MATGSLVGTGRPVYMAFRDRSGCTIVHKHVFFSDFVMQTARRPLPPTTPPLVSQFKNSSPRSMPVRGSTRSEGFPLMYTSSPNPMGPFLPLAFSMTRVLQAEARFAPPPPPAANTAESVEPNSSS